MLQALSNEVDVIELGVPFTDPMADGATIQHAAHVALKDGTTLRWILGMLGGVAPLGCPVVLMGYLNPFLAYGLRRLVRDAADVGVHGFIVPDLPFEEGGDLDRATADAGLARVQLVTPLTPKQRLRRLCEASGGFVYAVTITGVTGGRADLGKASGYLDTVREVSPVPVCAGFGIATATDVTNLVGHADGAVVGSALLRAIDAGQAPVDFMAGLVA
jgi:tryptophan synthase alpha chain